MLPGVHEPRLYATKEVQVFIKLINLGTIYQNIYRESSSLIYF